jgi:hypothetical protein
MWREGYSTPTTILDYLPRTWFLGSLPFATTDVKVWPSFNRMVVEPEADRKLRICSTRTPVQGLYVRTESADRVKVLVAKLPMHA